MSIEIETRNTLADYKWVLIPFALAVYVCLIFIIQPFKVDWGWAVTDLSEVVLGALGALIFALVARRFNWFSTRPGQIAMLLMLGLVLLSLGDLTFTLYESVGESPFPSLADVFYLTAYIPFAVAMLLNIKTTKMKFSPAMLVTWIVLSVIAFIFVVWFAFIPIVQTGVDVTIIISLAYPFEDLVIIVLALAIMLKFSSGEIARPWALLVLGFILEAIGDIWFETASDTNNYYVYHPSDWVLSLAYVFIIASGLFFVMMYRLRGGRKSA